MLDNERTRIHKILDELNFPLGRYVLSGSGVMVLHGIDRRPRDIDIFCATASWFSLYNSLRTGSMHMRTWNLFVCDPDDAKRRCDPPYLYRDMYGIEVNIFSDWRKRGIGDIDVNNWIHNAEIVDGVPCVPLQLLLSWKEQVGRDKDQRDIEVLRQFLRDARVP